MKNLVFGMIALMSTATVAQKQTPTPTYPTNSQIQLLITQAERAFANYEAAVQLEATEFGAAAGAAQDHEVTVAAKDLLARLKKEPQNFNSPFGFVLVIDLDDASRDMAVCMSQGANSAMGLASEGHYHDATRKMTVSRTCLDSSQLLYTVSESATQLYEDYLLANAVLQNQAVEALQKCSNVMKEHPKNP